MKIRTNFKFLINVKNGDQQATRDQSRAPLTETRRALRSVPKSERIPVKLTFALAFRSRSLHKKKFCEKLVFSPLTLFKSDHSRL